MRCSKLMRMLRDRSGQAILIFSLASPIALGGAGMAVDLSMWVRQKDSLQTIADAAALAAAYELARPSASVQASAEAAARGFVVANGKGKDVDVDVDLVKRRASVKVSEAAIITFGGLFGIDDFSLSATSTAETHSEYKEPCVIALDTSAKIGVNFGGSGGFTANCVVWSMSTAQSSITIGGSVTVDVKEDLCTDGAGKGYVVNGTAARFNKVPQQGCHLDPGGLKDLELREWNSIDIPTCTRNLVVNAKGDYTLPPGRYCGGVQISATGNVTLGGLYIMSNGPMKITAEGSVTGNKVGIYLVGRQATFDVAGSASVVLSAVAADDTYTGDPMAGVVVASDPNQTGNLSSRISGGAQVNLLGTVYLPKQDLVWRGNSSAAQATEVTLLVAKTVDVAGTTDITFKADAKAAGFDPITVGASMPYLSH
jgi:Flp pilus assembly protein TadG